MKKTIAYLAIASLFLVMSGIVSGCETPKEETPATETATGASPAPAPSINLPAREPRSKSQ